MVEVSPHVRVLALDDAPFARRRGASVLVVGVLSRGPRHVEGIFSTRCARDGWNATDRVLGMIEEHRLAEQARYVLTDGLAVGGFNLYDLPRLAERSGLGVLVVMRRPPKMDAIHRALERVSRPAARRALLERAGTIHRSDAPLCFFQCAGCEPEEGRAVLAAVTAEGNYPEPLRLAHLIGAGVMLGRSRARA